LTLRLKESKDWKKRGAQQQQRFPAKLSTENNISTAQTKTKPSKKICREIPSSTHSGSTLDG